MTVTLSFTDGTSLAFSRAPWADWTIRAGGSDTRPGLIGYDGEADQARLHANDVLFDRRELGSRSGERLARYQRVKVLDFERRATSHSVEYRDGERSESEGSRAWFVRLRYLASGRTEWVYAGAVLTALAGSQRGRWSRTCPTPRDDRDGHVWRAWEDVRDLSDVPRPERCGDMTFEKIEGEGSRAEVNDFLEGGPDGLVDHALGAVHGWKAAFVARYEGSILGAIVLTEPRNPELAAEGTEINISRLAFHPARPHNAASWMIARARAWAASEGYETISAHAGVGRNGGTCYDAAGFDLAQTIRADGGGWTNRSGRRSYRRGGSWQRRKWVYDLGEA